MYGQFELDCNWQGAIAIWRYSILQSTTSYAVVIYKRTGNLRAVQLLLGHTKIESTVKYLGVEVDDALDISEKVDI